MSCLKTPGKERCLLAKSVLSIWFLQSISSQVAHPLPVVNSWEKQIFTESLCSHKQITTETPNMSTSFFSGQVLFISVCAVYNFLHAYFYSIYQTWGSCAVGIWQGSGCFTNVTSMQITTYWSTVIISSHFIDVGRER